MGRKRQIAGAVMSVCDFVKAAGRGRRACGAGEVFGSSAQLPLKVPPTEPQPSTRPVLAACTHVASTKQEPAPPAVPLPLSDEGVA